jgi:hypothetical protein
MDLDLNAGTTASVAFNGQAMGGNGGNAANGDGGGGGDSHWHLSVASGGGGSISGGANGGNGGKAIGIDNRGGAGGSATSSAFGSALDGTNLLSVNTAAIGGNGGDGENFAYGGDGANAFLMNAVSGSTPGALYVRQFAQGGAGGRSDGSEAGLAGNADSRLTTSSASATVEAVTEATGGAGGDTVNGNATSGGAGVAETRLLAANAGMAHARATGGRGGQDQGPWNNGSPGAGGNARAFSSIDAGTDALATASATGGLGGGGETHGEVGGDADAEAYAAGVGNVTATATATAGGGGPQYGDARAESRATTAGLERVATAVSTITGSGGAAVATANSSGGRLSGISSRAQTGLRANLFLDDSIAVAHAIATVGGTTTLDVPVVAGQGETMATVVGLPGRNVLEEILSTSPVVAEAFADGVDPLFAAVLGASSGINVHHSMQASRLFFTVDVGMGPGLELLLGLTNPVGVDDGFESLHLQAFADGETLLDMSFTDVIVASAWFDDRLLNLGRLNGGADGLVDLELSLDFVGRSFGDGFYFNAVGVSTVPVPATAWLLASALGFLGFAARSPRPA